MKRLFLLCTIILCIAVPNVFAEEDLKIEVSYRESHSTKYFGVIDFVFNSNTQDWIYIKRVKLDFGKEEINKIVKFTSGAEYQAWAQGIHNRKTKTKKIFAGIGMVLGMAAATSNNSDTRSAGVLTAIGSASALSASDFNSKYETIDRSLIFPPGHLFSGEIIIPPGLLMHRFIVINTSRHKEIGFLKTFNLELEFKNGKILKKTFEIYPTNSEFFGSWQKDVATYGGN